MSYIRDLIADVNTTHASLGELIAFLQIAVKAKKMVLVISPTGCGKSTAMSLIAKHIPDAWLPDRLSIAGLATVADKLTNFTSVIVVDDIATTQTDYARKTTIATLVALAYTHRVESAMMGIEYSIENFHGSALVGIQPIMLRSLMLVEEWEASIQDKALRYYHCFRPLSPNLTMPIVQIEMGIDIAKVKDFEPGADNQFWHKLLILGNSQWSKARSREHLKDLLRAVVSLEDRTEVIEDDYVLLLELLRPMAIENAVVVKEQLEGERFLDNNLLALLVEYYTYGGEFSLAQVAQDYKLTLSQCYRIMQEQNEYWQQISKSPTIYRPTKRLISLLQTFNLDIKEKQKNDNEIG